ncbi:uncharacterized protein LOC113507525, partial [Trichoplusia ni]|uniref:Uncharacterized protein LOC113507525 n=1 Tax=Trichoplusia ni TaxID=7111 RepID=A0A7E5X123_TRINI
AIESQILQKRKRALNDASKDKHDDDSTSGKRDRTTAPSLIARSKYSNTDVAPQIVFASLVESDPKSGTSIHPVKFGQMLMRLKVKNITQDGIKRIGRNRISVKFKGPEDANAFLNNADVKSKGYITVIPTFNMTRMGVVKGVPADWTDLECFDDLSTPVGFGKILKIRRMNRKVQSEGKTEWVPTSTVVLTFDGRILPERVFCCHNALPVELYHFPTVQCYGCCKYGHTKTQCRSKPRCYLCGAEHFGDSCTVDEPKCLYCDGRHNANSQQCPEYSRQRNIKICMSEKNISYSEAAKLFPAAKKSFADVLASAPSTSHPLQPSPTPHPMHSHQASTTSYRKTVFLRPKTHAPLAPGYDQRAHQDLINSYSFPPSPNGRALLENPTPPSEKTSTIEQIVMLLTTLLSNYSLPDHVATNLLKAIQTHHIPSPAVERQECSPKKT